MTRLSTNVVNASVAALAGQTISEPINAGIVGKQTTIWKYGIVTELVTEMQLSTNAGNVWVSA